MSSPDDDPVIIHIDAANKREGLPEYSQDDPCPHCGGPTESGFGLAGGGFGVYSYCVRCEKVVSKSEVNE